jgi:hypothetical protein
MIKTIIAVMMGNFFYFSIIGYLRDRIAQATSPERDPLFFDQDDWL